ncbi:MAG: NAD(P)H-hydrate dehydratase [Pseudomonadota bacterium]
MNFQTAILTTQQMDEADRLAVAAGKSAISLMEEAGKAVARAIEQQWSKRSVIVLCGPGNNGGDGFVTARRLSEAGWPVQLALLGGQGAQDRLTGAARYHSTLWTKNIEPLTLNALEGAKLVVDALFGAGLSRPLEGIAKEILAVASHKHLPIVAIDVPSGLMGNTGEALGAVKAELTVTFFRKKPAHLLLPGRTLCGKIIVADIGIPSDVLENIAPTIFENDPNLWLSQLPQTYGNSNKYSRGHAFIYGGYPLTGAARLAAFAAARAGAGLTTVAVPLIAYPIYAAALTSIMVLPLSKPEDLEARLTDPRISALLIGPGAGINQETRAYVHSMLDTKRAVVLDADALTMFQNDPSSLTQAIKGPCVLTPHEGEFRRLFNDIHADDDKLTRTRLAATRSRAIIVLKGCDTVITSPNGQSVINSNAPPTLATAGAGDVLSGIIVGLLAQGMDPFLASLAGVWLHGAAATEFGPGLIADDLPNLLPKVLRHLYHSNNLNA